jgi:prefoldin subunit 5
MDQKTEMKRLKNRVADVSKSREKWRDKADASRREVEQLQAQNAALQEQVAALKKGGLDFAVQ